MTNREFYYRWQWQLEADAERLWPLVADTNHFDRDAGLPAYAENESAPAEALTNSRRLLRIRFAGVPLDYVEEPFEWVRPFRFGNVRNYLPGPIPLLQPLAQLRVLAQLRPRPGGGTELTYEVWARPRNLLGYLAIPLQIGVISARRFGATFRKYDQLAMASQSFIDLPGQAIRFPSGGRHRLAAIQQALIKQGAAPDLVGRLVQMVEQADDLTLSNMRPYALADQWRLPRRQVLEVSLLATRLGLLDFRWNLLCPLCRVAKERVLSLADINRQVHCDTCRIDYKANFERSVELTFRPNPAVRLIDDHVEYCTAGPQAMPHVAIQQLLPPGETRTVTPQLEVGRYRLRCLDRPGGQFIQVADGGQQATLIGAGSGDWPEAEISLSPTPELALENWIDREQLFILERMAWTDQAVTAAEVTTLQRFRDLFAAEALRPGDQISVGTLSILFTDLRGSTQMYQEIGDAPAFGLVMDHFDVLREAIAAENGAIVKTIGDAVMAAFRQPLSALRAISQAQATLANPVQGQRPLQLKAALHHGPCIAVSLNGRLDYFGSVVNVASRLEKFSQGGDVIISDAVYRDPEVYEFLTQGAEHWQADGFQEMIRGYGDGAFALWRVQRKE